MADARSVINEIFGEPIKPLRVVLSAPVFTESGYGVHSRQVASWLLEKHRAKKIELVIHAVPWGNTPWLLDGSLYDGFIGEMQRLTVQKEGVFDVSIQLKLPNEWDDKMATVNIGVTAAVETDRCNPEWLIACNRMTHVVVPSDHIKKTLEASGKLTVPLSVIPESFPKAFLSDNVEGRGKANSEELRATLDSLPTGFNFLVFGQLTGDARDDRKNTHMTIKLLSEVFANDSDVGIIVKTNMGRNTVIDRELTTNVLRQSLAATRKGTNNVPVYLLHGSMNEDEVRSLLTHEKTRAMVSLTRGEGWGLPMLEAAACGLPVIATDWSGHLDFMNMGKFLRVNYDLRPIPPSRVDNAIFMKGSQWAEPRSDDFRKKIMKFRESSTIPSQWATDLKKSVREKYSPDTVQSLYDTELGKYVVR